MKKTVFVVAILSIVLTAAGCGQTSPPIKPKPEHRPRADQQIKIDPQRAELVKAAVRKVRGVQDGTAVVVDQDISTAIKVSGFDRLRIKSIRNETINRIRAKNQGFRVYLTSDKKLFKQLKQLEEETREPLNSSPLELKTKINKIISDM